MLDDELIEGSGGCHKHSAGTSASSPCPAGTLPGRSNRPGIAGHDTSIKRADIDTEFKSICRHNAKDASVAQSSLNFPPFSRQIAPAVTANRFWLAWFPGVRLLQIGKDHFGV